jgi:hypothetical protein
LQTLGSGPVTIFTIIAFSTHCCNKEYKNIKVKSWNIKVECKNKVENERLSRKISWGYGMYKIKHKNTKYKTQNTKYKTQKCKIK